MGRPIIRGDTIRKRAFAKQIGSSLALIESEKAVQAVRRLIRSLEVREPPLSTSTNREETRSVVTKKDRIPAIHVRLRAFSEAFGPGPANPSVRHAVSMGAVQALAGRELICQKCAIQHLQNYPEAIMTPGVKNEVLGRSKGGSFPGRGRLFDPFLMGLSSSNLTAQGVDVISVGRKRLSRGPASPDIERRTIA